MLLRAGGRGEAVIVLLRAGGCGGEPRLGALGAAAAVAGGYGTPHAGVYSVMVDTASGYTRRRRCRNGVGCPRLGRLGSGGGTLRPSVSGAPTGGGDGDGTLRAGSAGMGERLSSTCSASVLPRLGELEGVLVAAARDRAN